MLNWGKPKHCNECQNKDALINNLQQAIYMMAKDLAAAEFERDKAHSELRKRPIVKDVNTSDEHLLKVNRLMNQMSKLIDENKRLRKKYDLIVDSELPLELTKDIRKSKLPVRLANLLRNEFITSYVDLVDYTEAQLLRTPNFGVKTLKVLKEHLISEFPNCRQHFKLLEKTQ